MGQVERSTLQVRDGVAVLPGPPPVAVALRRSAQARRLNLRVSGLDGRVTMSMPRHLPLPDALEFLQQKEPWLRAALGRMPRQQPVRVGGQILLRGQMRLITESDTVRRVTEADDLVLVPPDPSGQRTRVRLSAYCQTAAQAELFSASEHYATRLGRHFSALCLRDTRSRWGSCTAKGRLMYSWRLIMAPPQVLRYVAAHEVAHLKHMDHSRAFWTCVKKLMPDYEDHRAWLRQRGAELHSYSFSALPDAESG